MSRPGPTAPWAVARVLGLLAVVLGLLGMHGLAGTHSAAAAAPVHAPSPALLGDTPPPVHAPGAAHSAAESGIGTEAGTTVRSLVGTAAGVDGATVAGVVLEPGRSSAGWPGPTCDDHCADAMTAVCAAVLAAAAAASALSRAAARRPLLPGEPTRPPRAPALPRWLLPAPDPVAELCVSRT